MPSRYFVSIFFVMCITCLTLLSGCHNDNAPPPKFAFGDERYMQDALQGDWILQEYMDSIDAGLTPKLLEYMFDKVNLLQYRRAYGRMQMYTFARFKAAPDTCDLLFDPANNTILFKVVYNDGQHPASRTDTAEFIINGSDTVLHLRGAFGQTDYVRYSTDRCTGMDEYSHLINSKFIAGKYYALDDTARHHHIIFTRCGDIEGAEFIFPQLKDYSHYDVLMSGFRTGPDQMSLCQNHDGKMNVSSLLISWTVVNDSLILGKDIVLVKAR
jgi:hypothetical protein